MNLSGLVTMQWADGEYAFRLTFPGAVELEQKCGAAISVIATRVMSGQWHGNELWETIRLGLIGGGMPPLDALRMVRTYVEGRPLSESQPVARLIMMGLMFGFSEHPLAPAADGTTVSPNGSTPLKPTQPLQS